MPDPTRDRPSLWMRFDAVAACLFLAGICYVLVFVRGDAKPEIGRHSIWIAVWLLLIGIYGWRRAARRRRQQRAADERARTFD